MKETIYSNEYDDWTCLCKNTASGAGFYACDEDGNQVEPDKNWKSNKYVCFNCGKIIDQDTKEVVKQADVDKIKVIV